MTELPPEVATALMALREAVAEVIEEKVRNHWPIYIWRDGKVIDILPELLEQRYNWGRNE